MIWKSPLYFKCCECHGVLNLFKVQHSDSSYPTRQTSTSRINRKCVSVLIQVVVLLISSQINRCLADDFLMSIFFDLILMSQSLKIEVKK
jgi:hypothetical protein